LYGLQVNSTGAKSALELFEAGSRFADSSEIELPLPFGV
jgi:hypothetical protein